jgi:gliding motility-associated-like protein
MTRPFQLLAFLGFMVCSAASYAQANDECSGATVISDPTDFCTDQPGEDNTFASQSPQPFPSCFSSVSTDVWYTFTAVAPDVAVIVRGQTPSNPFGTMFGPQIALYSGDCNNLTELACAFDQNFSNNLPLFAADLVVGQQYFIRVDGVLPGVFELCVENKEVINVVAGDCPTATFVCSKDPIEVESVFNAGLDNLEMEGAPCLTGFTNIETRSAWYVFTAANNGKLEFTITPNEPNDDIDFILYRLPNGPGNCTGKISERCMAAGDFDASSPCMGPTGLNSIATDLNQPAGCAPGQDNFLRFLTLVPGATYALVINNFTSVGNGFTLEWGGDALFKGAATANFSTDEPDKKICLGEELTVTDSSFTSEGEIVSWQWDFGAGAQPDTIAGAGPHTIQYTTTGPKSIFLTVITDAGCVGLDTAFVLVEFCCTMEAEVSVNPGCPGNPPTPAEAQASTSNALEPISYSWSNGANTNPADIDSSGTYYIIVEDANGCKDSVSFQVTTPWDVTATFPKDTTIQQGETISLGVVANPTDSLTITWTDEAGNILTGPVQALSPDSTTTYQITVTNYGCISTSSVTITVKLPRFERPNAFTPNGDGSNDTFGPVLVGHTLQQMEIWSRWGEKIFDSLVEGSNTWDGTINGNPAPSDVYVYRMRVKLVDGQEKIEKGDVTLLR